MEVTRLRKHYGVDSWEGEMVCQGATFIVEAEETVHQGQTMWSLEIYRPSSTFVLDPLYYRAFPTLDAALDGAEQVIRDLVARNT